MNLRKILNWANPQTQPTGLKAEPAAALRPTETAASNVVSLPSRSPLDSPAGLTADLDASLALPVRPAQVPCGLLGAPEIKAFFANNHFGLGCHDGAQYKTQDALLLGKQSLVCRFQNVVSELAGQKQIKVNGLQQMKLQTQGVCSVTTEQLNLACANLERDITTLQDQIEKAADSKGWVLDALNQYQIGFNKGLRAAINFELLTN